MENIIQTPTATPSVIAEPQKPKRQKKVWNNLGGTVIVTAPVKPTDWTDKCSLSELATLDANAAESAKAFAAAKTKGLKLSKGILYFGNK